jgi:hypothetical protein
MTGKNAPNKTYDKNVPMIVRDEYRLYEICMANAKFINESGDMVMRRRGSNVFHQTEQTVPLGKRCACCGGVLTKQVCEIDTGIVNLAHLTFNLENRRDATALSEVRGITSTIIEGHEKKIERITNIKQKSRKPHAIISRKNMDIGSLMAVTELYLVSTTKREKMKVRFIEELKPKESDSEHLKEWYQKIRSQLLYSKPDKYNYMTSTDLVNEISSECSRIARSSWSGEITGEECTYYMTQICQMVRFLCLKTLQSEAEFVYMWHLEHTEFEKKMTESALNKITGDDPLDKTGLETLHDKVRNLPLSDSSYADGLHKGSRHWEKWTEATIGRQCWVCEEKQGDGDIIKRTLDAISLYKGQYESIPASTITGLAYHHLSLEKSNTVWDLVAEFVEKMYAAISEHWIVNGEKDENSICQYLRRLNDNEANRRVILLYLTALYFEIGINGTAKNSFYNVSE